MTSVRNEKDIGPKRASISLPKLQDYVKNEEDRNPKRTDMSDKARKKNRGQCRTVWQTWLPKLGDTCKELRGQSSNRRTPLPKLECKEMKGERSERGEDDNPSWKTNVGETRHERTEVREERTRLPKLGDKCKEFRAERSQKGGRHSWVTLPEGPFAIREKHQWIQRRSQTISLQSHIGWPFRIPDRIRCIQSEKNKSSPTPSNGATLWSYHHKRGYSCGKTTTNSQPLYKTKTMA